MKLIPIGLGLLTTLGAGYAVLSVPHDQIIAAYSTSLAERSRSQRHNAALALGRLHGATIGPGEIFSFNARVGSFSRDQGYRKAPVSYNGQLIDDWGGGVCQTSTTMYNAALLAGLEIVERNRHRFAPSYVPPGRDAAVAFSNIDLRLRNPYASPLRVEGVVVGDRLEVRIKGSQMPATKFEVVSEVRERHAPATFRLGTSQGRFRVRNTGKVGCDVTVVRISGDRKEIISQDSYPAMNRVEQTEG